jgi:dolichol-phosphate mannosyltransferase
MTARPLQSTTTREAQAVGQITKRSPDVTVVVPTRNEVANFEPLVRRLGFAMAGTGAHVLFVDDSDDETPQEVARVAALEGIGGLTVAVLHRQPSDRAGGLGGAVLAGLRNTISPWVVVMDGDLQHPPEQVPHLLEQATTTGADLVVASRHVAGGSASGLDGLRRAAVSGAATALSKLLFPRRLAGVSDPMSGFFAVRRDALSLDAMRPQGFKVLLEMLARQPGIRRAEMPFEFAERFSGRSKASLSEGLTFVVQLLRLRLASIVLGWHPGVLARGVGFGLVGATGLAVNTAVMWLLADAGHLGLHYLLAAALTTQVSSTWNFLLADTLIYRGHGTGRVRRRYAGFMAVSNVVLLLRLPLLSVLAGVLGLHYLLANLLTLLLGYAVRFGSLERLNLAKELS